MPSTSSLRCKKVASAALAFAVLLALIPFAFAEGTAPTGIKSERAPYLDVDSAFTVCDTSAKDKLLEQWTDGTTIFDTPIYPVLARCGCFSEERDPASLYATLTETNGFPVFSKGDEYSPESGDLVFGFSTDGKAVHVRAAGETELIRSPRTRIVRPEYPLFEELIYLYLRNECRCSKATACGIISNMYWESLCDPYAVERRDGRGFGLCQWTGVERIKLKQWCKENGLEMSDFYNQLDFLKYEMESEEYHIAWAMAKSVTDNGDGAYDAAHVFCIMFEKPENYEIVAEDRGATAQDAFWEAYRGCGV